MGYQMSETLSKNMELIAHHDLNGFGGVGEGMALQVTKNGKRVLWIAHEGPPKNFTGVDVTDPRKPKIICQTELPHEKMLSNSLVYSLIVTTNYYNIFFQ